ncbi:hypothetical protein MYXO_00543 [Myxococcaceae bacterium]|jgi:hypothetical protein|nr:hypothetical protein MYXO_00543 [Myxococcaceae bacterium]
MLVRSPILPALLLTAAAALGCSGYSRNVLQQAGENRVVLRSEKTGIGGVETKGYDHPSTISGTRLAHILSRIDIRTDDADANSRKPGIPAELVYELGEKLSNALAKATPDQEVVIVAARRERSLGVFTHDYITSFSAFVKGDTLHIRLYHLDWHQPQGGEAAKVDDPQPDRQVMKFRVVPGQSMIPEGTQGLAVSWRDPIFRSPTAVRVTPEGKIVRRTVLMESEAPPEDGLDETPLPSVTSGDLSPDQLRALADLEEARRDGEVNEGEYQTRRARILRGEVSAPPKDPAPN